MPRSADELLAHVYRRSDQIRRRRLALRLTAGSASIALIVTAVTVQLVGKSVLSPRAPAAPRVLAPASGGHPAAPAAEPGARAACSCEANLRQAGPRGDRPLHGGTIPPARRAGYRLAFASDRDGDFDIYTMNADGSGVRRLTDGPAADRDPQWSPDGAEITFARFERITDVYGDIYTMKADGTHVRYLTAGGGPKWSPDGTMLAFHALHVAPGETYSSVWIINADGSGRREVARMGGDPAWARDGRHLVYGGLHEGIVNVFSVALDGSGVRKVSNDPLYACEPDVSPDGTLVAHVASAPTQVRVLGLDGSSARRLTDSSEWEYSPSWTPDGELIAFARDPDGDVHYPVAIKGVDIGMKPSVIVLVNANGTAEVTLSAGAYSDTDPSFSPRGP